MRLAVFALNVILSAALLMMVQPMAARMLLPRLGGSPSVWNASMVFFQAGLLGGYAYACLAPRWLGERRHSVVHVVLLVATAAFLPISFPAPESAPQWPTLWVLRSLAMGLAVPFVLLAATSTLIQTWFVRCEGRDPYFLYAASNLGSFLGLILYPFAIEPHFGLTRQAELWHDGSIVFAITMAAAAAFVLLGARGVSEGISSSLANASGPQSTPWRRIVRWIALAMAPSSLLLSVTRHITTDLAPAPLLWIVPLGLYLLTFVVAFSRRTIVPRHIVVRYVPVVLLLLLLVWFSEATSPLVLVLVIHLVGFTWLALFCHGELAATRPPADRLAPFYFWIALGGVLGGAFNALAAPMLFSTYLEYPLMLIVAAVLRPDDTAKSRTDLKWAALLGVGCFLLVGAGRLLDLPAGPPFVAFVAVPLTLTLLLRDAWSYALALLMIVTCGSIYPSVHGDTLELRRSFFGVHRVSRDGDLIKLVHGNTVHGIQSQTDPREPLAYYHRKSPIADVLSTMNAEGRLKSVGVIGLGAGALAAYAKPDQTWTFFELDPDVLTLAQSRFTYLKSCPATLRFVLGDARLTLEQSSEKFDLLIVDAFGSDSIPTHLLTREALDLYAEHLNPGGAIAFHVSNRYLDLFPILATTPERGWHAYTSHGAWPTSDAERAAGKLTSWWAVLAPPSPAPFTLAPGRWRPLTPSPNIAGWTDDFIDLPAVVRWNDLWSVE